MDPYKTNRMNAAIQRALSDLIATRVKDPRVGLVSISQVELNRDHSQAKVYVVVTGGEEDREASLIGLKKAKGFLQGQLADTLRMRTMPDLQFELDDAMDRGFGIEETLRELAEKGEFMDEAERTRRLRLEDLVPDQRVVEAIRAADTVWLTGHWSPDPDCMGAALGLALVLDDLGKDATVFRFPDPPVGLTTLPGWDDTVPAEDAPEMAASAPPDLALLIDCHRTDRIGPLQDTFDRLERVMCIDHHLVSGRRAPEPGWVEDRAESTCTLVYRLIQDLAPDGDDAIDEDVATNLFAGLAGDTGGFRFDNVRAATFRLAADLVERGADPAEIQENTLHRRRREGLGLMCRALDTVRFTPDGKVVVMRVDRHMLEATGAGLSETEGYVNMLTAVEGVQSAALLKQIEPDVWRASLRSNSGDVQQVAAAFGGGGHARAAGCTIEGEGDEVARRVTEALRQVG